MAFQYSQWSVHGVLTGQVSTHVRWVQLNTVFNSMWRDFIQQLCENLLWELCRCISYHPSLTPIILPVLPVSLPGSQFHTLPSHRFPEFLWTRNLSEHPFILQGDLQGGKCAGTPVPWNWEFSLFFFLFFFTGLKSRQDLSLPTRDRTHAPCSGGTDC